MCVLGGRGGRADGAGIRAAGEGVADRNLLGVQQGAAGRTHTAAHSTPCPRRGLSPLTC